MPRRGPLSFSLGGLLLTTSCLAVALAITNWSLWNNDERWLLRVWFAAAITLGLVDRLRGTRGILAAALGGGLAPALLTLQMWQSPTRFGMNTTPWIGELGHNAVLLALFGGGLAAGLLAALCWLGPRYPGRTAGSLAGLTILIALAVWGIEASRWRPRMSVQRMAARLRPALALSGDGRMLVAAENALFPPDEPTLELWSLAGKTADRIGTTRIHHPISDIEFSPDGTLLVAVPQLDRLHLVGSGPVPPVLWFDLAARLREPPAQSAYRWLLEDACFAPDGKSLIVVGRSAIGQRHRLAIDAVTRQPTSCLPLDERALTAIHPLGTGVVQRQSDPRWFRDEDDSTVRRSPSRRPMPHAELIVAHDDRWLVARDHVIESATRHVRRLNANAIASVSGGRWILAARTADIPDRQTASLPFLRHYYRYEGAKTQFVLIDPATGRIVRSSTWQRTLGSLAVSRDGLVLATSAASGQILIWDVPR
jgi:hypothetical protein